MAAPSTDTELLVEEVRDLHTAFDRFRNNPTLILRALRRVLLDLVTQVQDARPEALTWAEATTAIASSDWTTGWTFQSEAPLAVVRVEAAEVGTGEWQEVERLGADGRRTNIRVVGVEIRRGTLFPVDDMVSVMAAYTQWRVRYVAAPSALAFRGANASITQVPLAVCRNALVYGTAAELAAGMQNEEDAPDLEYFSSRRDAAYGLALQALTGDQKYEPFRKMDVMGGGLS